MAWHRYAVAMLYSKAFPFLLVLAIEMPFAVAQTNPAKMATQARFDLSSASIALENGEVLEGSGKLERMNWATPEAKKRGYTANFAVSHYAWSEIKVRFLPKGDGSVDLKLMGPWEEASKGVPYREEVLWDKIQVPGSATLRPGDFIHISAAGAAGDGDSPDFGTPKDYAAHTWHNAPLIFKVPVTNDVPVTLTLFAKAAIPKDFKEMRRLTASSRAFQSAKSFQRGANLGNYLEAPPGQDWGMKYSAEDFVHIKEEGFDHVRLPIGWHHYAGPGLEFTLRPAIFEKVDFLVTNALAQKLNVIVNIHHFDAFTSNPDQQTNKFYALWKQIASHYAGSPSGVAFELINEPKDKATTAVLNPIYAETIRLIRTTNPRRPIFLGPSKWNSIDELPLLQLPDNDENLIVTVHCYDPFYFTHQGAGWAGADVKTKGIIFPGPPKTPLTPDASLNLSAGVSDWLKRYNGNPTETNPSSPKAFRPKLKRAKQWSDYYGRPIHVGEFGAYVAADAQSRENFYREFRKTLDELQLGWAIWDWKAGFKYWDGEKSQPAPGMRAALFDTAKP